MAMTDAEPSPYGSWPSPITGQLIVSEVVSLGQVQTDGDCVYWLEVRPSEAGRSVVVRQRPGASREDCIPTPYSARTRVHEYGGGSYVAAAGRIYFTHFQDQRLYSLRPGEAPVAVTAPGPLRYADLTLDTARGRLIAVVEDHSHPGEPRNSLGAIQLGDGQVRTLASGADFYAAPALSPDGRWLAWLSWSHPDMPWDGTELWLAEVAPDGALHASCHVAGSREESVFQPQWSPEGQLYFVSDRSGWWNLYRLSEGAVEAVTALDAELGLPQWVLGLSTYAFSSPDRVVCSYQRGGSSRLALIDTRSLEMRDLETGLSSIASVRALPGKAFVVGASPTGPAAVVGVVPETGEHWTVRAAARLDLDPGYLSVPEPIAFPTSRGETAYAFFYPPRNRDCAGPSDELPPLLVMSHGGPTGTTSNALDLRIQFWTSRGSAVVDVNYRGSTGYGRGYRQRLYGEWGVLDVDDCVHAARYLVSQHRVDGHRLAIRGSSAGGYTTLAALTFTDAFQAGASHYGVSDLEALARETHKFESRYLDKLIGPYSQCQDLYRVRSPIHAARRLDYPVIFFQGAEDRIVPPGQAEAMVEALRDKGLPVAYVLFEGEQHGFRRGENIRRALEAELSFYGQVFGFKPADELEPVKVENLAGP